LKVKARCLFLAIMLFWLNLAAGTISGQLTVDTLKVADSPISVIGNISVPSWHTLTIEPGVILKFDAGLSFTIDGTLNAVGTEADSIFFHSNAATPQSGDWSGLIFNTASAGSLHYCSIKYASVGLTENNATFEIKSSTFSKNTNGIDCRNGSAPVIQLNTFTANENTAIRCTDSSPSILQNKFLNNVSVSSTILCQNSSPTISQNLISRNLNEGISCVNGSKPNIWQNTFYDNNLGIAVNDSSGPIIKNNIIIGNKQFGVAVIDTSATEVIEYNDVWGNEISEFVGTDVSVGNLTTSNSNGHASDVHNNIRLNPVFVDTAAGNFHLLVASPCIDAGDAANPAGITFWGNAPDLGAYEYDGALPVELVSFRIVDRKLIWTTATETNNFGFEVQRRSETEQHFQRVAFIPGAGTTLVPQHYEYDESDIFGVYFYRLKQIDTDGTFSFSDILKAAFSEVNSFELYTNYPNPFNPSTTISFHVPFNRNREPVSLILSIFNIRGEQIVTLLDDKKVPGEYKLNWRGVDNLGNPVASGVYFYRLKMGDNVLSKRMLLLK